MFGSNFFDCLFFFGKIAVSRSRDLICIFFYTGVLSFSDSLFRSSFVAIGLNRQDIDDPSTFEGN